jgi:serine phosphatase RsbU (regulator of sigma subunit)
MRRVWGQLSSLTLVLLVALTAVLALVVQGAVDSQENRLLKERANELALVFRPGVDALSSQLESLGAVVRTTNAAPGAFARGAQPILAQAQRPEGIALLRQGPTGFRVVLAEGRGLHVGELVAGVAAPSLVQALHAGQLVPTPVIGTGATRAIGFALGPPSAPPGDVLYQQTLLGPLGPPRQANTAPFNELRVVLYDAPTADPSQAIVTTSNTVPLSGHVRLIHIAAGDATWALQVSAAHPLVGSTADHAAWIAAAIGALLSALVALMIEVETRRRRSALALYRNEHQLAEGLQRSLLPELPEFPGIEIAGCYLAGSADQQVGGDWYDVFDLGRGRIGLAIGDVLGHDIAAAALMSRVQTALRAYAFLGAEPGSVLDRLDRLLATLQSERLVTLFFGVLSPAAANGSRKLVFANAGHPAPLVYDPESGVRELEEAGSLLLGVTPVERDNRPQHAAVLRPGSTLLLYTDGLIEVPGVSLTDRIDNLKAVTAAAAPGTAPQQLGDMLLDTMAAGKRRDDVALLLARLAPAPRRRTRRPAGAGRSGAS